MNSGNDSVKKYNNEWALRRSRLAWKRLQDAVMNYIV